MFLGPHRTCVEPNAGCNEIFGSRSMGPIAGDVEVDVGVEVAMLGRKEWDMVGRRGVIDVKVLETISVLC